MIRIARSHLNTPLAGSCRPVGTSLFPLFQKAHLERSYSTTPIHKSFYVVRINNKERWFDGKTGIIIYEGNVKDGLPHGQGKAYDLNTGEKIFEGTYINGKAESGYIKVFSSVTNHLIYEGGIENNKMHGKGKMFDCKTGKLIYEGSFQNGKMEGLGKLFGPVSGSLIYEGEFQNNAEHGKGKLFDCKTGKLIYEGEMEKGSQNGFGRLFDISTGKQTFEGIFKNNIPVLPIINGRICRNEFLKFDFRDFFL